jgi:predicted nuclease of predicted toxin-antitoxin system
MIRLLADENFPAPVIDDLVAAGHDVLSVARGSPGISDAAVLRLACDEGRRLLTFDSDFGDLVFFHGAVPPPAILYFRIHPVVLAEVRAAALRAVAEVPEGCFAVIGVDSIRLRMFQAAGAGG